MKLSIFQNIAKNQILCLLLIFALFFTLFFLIQFASLNLTGVDAYYHIKCAYLYRTLGIEETLNNFDILKYTILGLYPSDLAFLYHLLLIPFTYGNLIVGSKISAALLASLIFALFYWVLKKFKIKYSFGWTCLLLASSSSFIFRLTLSRSLLLSILFSILAFYFIIKKKHGWLFVLSFFYGLTYAAISFIPILGLVYILTEYYQTKKLDWKPLFYPVMGILIGLTIRPDFPQNFYMIFVQNFYVLFYKIKGIQLDIGGEWYPISASLKTNLIFLILFSSALTFNLIDLVEKRIRKSQLPLIRLYAFSLSLAFCFFTFVSQRFFEYWTPFTLFLAAFTFQDISQDKYWKDLFRQFLQITGHFLNRLKFFFLILFCLIIISGSYLNIAGAINSMEETIFPFDKYQSVSQWLKENTPARSIVFNAGWDNFPQLFFYNHQNYYLVGLDPTFMYLYNQELYWLWNNMTRQGIVCAQPKKECPDSVYTEKFSQRSQKIEQIVKNKFQSKYVFIDDWSISDQPPRHQVFKKLLENSPLFEKVYQDKKYPTVMIFQLTGNNEF